MKWFLCFHVTFVSMIFSTSLCLCVSCAYLPGPIITLYLQCRLRIKMTNFFFAFQVRMSGWQCIATATGQMGDDIRFSCVWTPINFITEHRCSPLSQNQVFCIHDRCVVVVIFRIVAGLLSGSIKFPCFITRFNRFWFIVRIVRLHWNERLCYNVKCTIESSSSKLKQAENGACFSHSNGIHLFGNIVSLQLIIDNFQQIFRIDRKNAKLS